MFNLTSNRVEADIGCSLDFLDSSSHDGDVVVVATGLFRPRAAIGCPRDEGSRDVVPPRK